MITKSAGFVGTQDNIKKWWWLFLLPMINHRKLLFPHKRIILTIQKTNVCTDISSGLQ
jgi:hypothetical protein